MAQSVKQQILSRIYGRGRGWAFTPSDFIQDFKRWEISNSLEDLANEILYHNYLLFNTLITTCLITSISEGLLSAIKSVRANNVALSIIGTPSL